MKKNNIIQAFLVLFLCQSAMGSGTPDLTRVDVQGQGSYIRLFPLTPTGDAPIPFAVHNSTWAYQNHQGGFPMNLALLTSDGTTVTPPDSITNPDGSTTYIQPGGFAYWGTITATNAWICCPITSIEDPTQTIAALAVGSLGVGFQGHTTVVTNDPYLNYEFWHVTQDTLGMFISVQTPNYSQLSSAAFQAALLGTLQPLPVTPAVDPSQVDVGPQQPAPTDLTPINVGQQVYQPLFSLPSTDQQTAAIIVNNAPSAISISLFQNGNTAASQSVTISAGQSYTFPRLDAGNTYSGLGSLVTNDASTIQAITASNIGTPVGLVGNVQTLSDPQQYMAYNVNEPVSVITVSATTPGTTATATAFHAAVAGVAYQPPVTVTTVPLPQQ